MLATKASIGTEFWPSLPGSRVFDSRLPCKGNLLYINLPKVLVVVFMDRLAFYRGSARVLLGFYWRSVAVLPGFLPISPHACRISFVGRSGQEHSTSMPLIHQLLDTPRVAHKKACGVMLTALQPGF